MKFEVGQHIRLIAVTRPENYYLLNEIGFIHSLCESGRYNIILDNGERRSALACQMVRVDYNGNEPGSWEDCVWKPKALEGLK